MYWTSKAIGMIICHLSNSPIIIAFIQQFEWLHLKHNMEENVDPIFIYFLNEGRERKLIGPELTQQTAKVRLAIYGQIVQKTYPPVIYCTIFFSNHYN